MDPKIVQVKFRVKNVCAVAFAAAAAGANHGHMPMVCMLLIFGVFFECWKMDPKNFQDKFSVKNVFVVAFAVAGAAAKPWANPHGLACC